MKTVNVSAGACDHQVFTTVQLLHSRESDRLTPKLARCAARIGFGHTLGVTVSDGNVAYRLTASGCKRVVFDQDAIDYNL